MNYADAGVSIARGDALVARIAELARGTKRPGVMDGIGGFGGLFDLAAAGCRDPVLVSGADGVGTKIKLAAECGRHAGIGVDLVAMCVNDVLTLGAEPLFFLDYFACSRLDAATAETVLGGIAAACREAGCALLGGETAEMPGMYKEGEYDLAGFCVGVAERARLLRGDSARPGDLMLALPSNGAHANGYSLIRKILADTAATPDTPLDGRALIDHLLTPTRIYAKEIRALLEAARVHGIAHVTGGGISGNLPRVLPAGLAARIDASAWEWPPLFHWLRERGGIATEEMYRVFNCGLGMLVVMPKEERERAREALAGLGVAAPEVGVIVESDGAERVVYSSG